MEKFPFTTEGVHAANEHFYALSDDALWNEVHAVQADFKAWMTAHFDIQGEDLDCLLGFNAHCTFILGNQLAVTMSLRLPFRLERNTPPDISLLGVKRGRNHNPIGSRLTGPNAPEGEGEFVYIIEA